jgi:glutamine amidotransferase
MNVTVLDYGVGNTASVRRAFERLGAEVDFTADPERVTKSRRIVLPGVGAFEPAMRRLNESGLGEAVKSAVASGARLLGLCLGYQLLFEKGFEFGEHRGLGLVPGEVRPLPAGVRIPHIGWNELRFADPVNTRLFRGLREPAYVYFVHSFRPVGVPPGAVAAFCEYGVPFPAAIEHGEIWGCQFHPEKSSTAGSRMLVNFLSEDIP